MIDEEGKLNKKTKNLGSLIKLEKVALEKLVIKYHQSQLKENQLNSDIESVRSDSENVNRASVELEIGQQFFPELNTTQNNYYLKLITKHKEILHDLENASIESKSYLQKIKRSQKKIDLLSKMQDEQKTTERSFFIKRLDQQILELTQQRMRKND